MNTLLLGKALSAVCHDEDHEACNLTDCGCECHKGV